MSADVLVSAHASLEGSAEGAAAGQGGTGADGDRPGIQEGTRLPEE